MDLFDEFEKRTAGIWLKTSNVKIGETFTILDVSIDDETYEDKIYWICDCTADMESEFRDSGEECKARLGKDLYEGVKADLGKDWIDNKLKVVRFKDYKGLGQKGIIWSGVKVAKQERIEPSPSQPRRTFEVGDQVKLWLLNNKSIIGSPIPPEIHNATDNEIFKELEDVGLFYFKDYYPHIHKDAAQIIQ